MTDNWQSAHLAALDARLDRVWAQPDGTLRDFQTPLHHIRIVKHAGQIHFYFVDAIDGALHGPMSRLDINRPLHLLAEYSQSAMLTLLWRPAPARVCLLGLAGGRLTLLFYHYFPETMIDNVDIDPAVGEIAATYFGVTFDARNTLTIQDARAFLEAGGPPYDIVIMDAFRDSSDNLDHLATREFYAACKGRMVRGGVLCANLLKSDALLYEKIKTFEASFRHVFVDELKHAIMLFGNDDTRFTRDDLMRRAVALQHAHGFDMPFVERAGALRAARAVPEYSRAALQHVRVLSDTQEGNRRSGGTT
jgi:spermidine synthase